MEEKLKYYTPILEEFHHNFNFEYFDESGKLIKDHSSNIYEWKSDICDWQWLDRISDDYEHDAENISKLYRVKFLDKEDIESLGFNDYKHGPSDWYKLEKRVPDGYASYGYWSNFRLVHNYNTHKIQIIAYEYGFDENDKYILFQGSCKNKSELKKLIKQLGI